MFLWYATEWPIAKIVPVGYTSAVLFSVWRNICKQYGAERLSAQRPLTCTGGDVHAFLRHLFVTFLHLGPLGPLFLGVLDSSFLFLPFGNDLLVVVLISRDKVHLALYVLCAALGSVLGVFLLDLVCRKAGQEGLEKMMTPSRFKYLEKRMRKGAAIAVIVACLAPPPFPFTLAIAAASAFEYPKWRLLAIVFAARMARYTLIGLLALWFGRQILRVANSEEFFWFTIGFIIFCGIGSAIQVRSWIRRSRLVAVS